VKLDYVRNEIDRMRGETHSVATLLPRGRASHGIIIVQSRSSQDWDATPVLEKKTPPR
jgi:hypothetical protein